MGEDRVPQLKDGTVYADWKKRVAVWEASTKTEPKKRAPTLITCMKGRPEQVAIQLDLSKLSTDKGVEHLITELDALFLPDNTQQVFNALDQFLNYSRPAGTSMEDYTREFTRLQKIELLNVKMDRIVRQLTSLTLSDPHSKRFKIAGGCALTGDARPRFFERFARGAGAARAKR